VERISEEKKGKVVVGRKKLVSSSQGPADSAGRSKKRSKKNAKDLKVKECRGGFSQAKDNVG